MMKTCFEFTRKSLSILEKIQESEIRSWVGGGNVQKVVAEGMNALVANTPVHGSMKILDYGCGIGRVSVGLAQMLEQERGQLLGVDIIPRLIDFCVANIEPIYNNTKFTLINDHNPRYDFHKGEVGVVAQTPEEFIEGINSSIDMIVAYSVFTHFTPEMALRHAKLFYKALRNSGIVYLSAFLESPLNPADRRLGQGEKFKDIPLKMPLSWALYRFDYLEQIFNEAGFQISKIVYGHWRLKGALPQFMYQGNHSHDIIVAVKQSFVPTNFNPAEYLSINPDLKLSYTEAADHYLRCGFYENRTWQTEALTQ